MADLPLDVKAMKAIIRIADTMEDISQKLDYIIEKQTEDYFCHHRCAQ